jgi:transposase InsO family protein
VLGQRPGRVVFATLKRELINTRTWPTRAAAHRAIFEYIESWYNLRRLHSALDYRSPPTTKPTTSSPLK